MSEKLREQLLKLRANTNPELWHGDSDGRKDATQELEDCLVNNLDAILTALAAPISVAESGNELEAYKVSLDIPELEDFVKGVVIEAAHQRKRWGDEHDAAKAPEDWFWTVGYLCGKAMRSQIDGDTEKFKHHLITGAALLANWHARVAGKLPVNSISEAERRVLQAAKAERQFAKLNNETDEDHFEELRKVIDATTAAVDALLLAEAALEKK